MRLFGSVLEQYADFADSAAGDSPCFEEWARGVVEDEELLGQIGTLPPIKQQPNLVFAAARWNGVPAPAPFDVLRLALLADWDSIRSTVLSRSTQTNEVGRLATLLPAFAVVEAFEQRPLALLEVGASAGLCLFPDRFGYRWSTPVGLRTTVPASHPVLHCVVKGPAPLPTHLPQVGWRAGVDLNPLDVRDDDAMSWLTTLVWPEQEDRRVRLRQAIEIARQEPPRLVRGDLFTTLPELMSEVPAETALIVFHSAVVAYLEPPDRVRFQRMMVQLVKEGACHWVSNEGAAILPEVTATLPHTSEDELPFVLGVDGQGVGRTHGHGTMLTWLPGRRQCG